MVGERPPIRHRPRKGTSVMATQALRDVRLEDHKVPKMPTATRVRYGDGRVLPVGGGLWLYRKAPLAP